MQRHCRAAMLGLLVAASGCVLPNYHLPHGFSSSYYRHLQSQQPLIAPAVVLPSGASHEAELPRSYQSVPTLPPVNPAL